MWGIPAHKQKEHEQITGRVYEYMMRGGKIRKKRMGESKEARPTLTTKDVRNILRAL